MSEEVTMKDNFSTTDENTIELALKPMNLPDYNKNNVNFDKVIVNKHMKVGDFAEELMKQLGIKDFQGQDANFLILGKSADHSLSFVN